MKSLELSIDGMSCGHCVARVEKALRKVDGVTVGEVKIGYAKVFYDPERANVAGLRAAIDDAGYEARAIEPASVQA